MRVTVLLFASLRERAGVAELTLDELPAELDVAALKRELSERFSELGSLEHVRGVLGQVYVDDATAVPDGSTVALIPPVSGGSPDSGPDSGPDSQAPNYTAGVFELSPDPLDPLACQQRVEHASCGAALVFTGMTRNHNRGQQVVRLEYEAYEQLAGPEMARIFERCRGELRADESPEQELRMLCQHRIGSVAIGEPSVVIAVCSPHRDQAFRATRFLIDELKKTLPVWKKEIYPGGEHWIGDRS